MRVREEAEMLTYDLNHRGQSSIYEYLYQCIRQDIQTGVLTAGERLPSKRSLARHLNIGVITVANAYEQLLTEGYIRAEERRGYFVQDISGYSRKADLRAEDYPAGTSGAGVLCGFQSEPHRSAAFSCGDLEPVYAGSAVTAQ